MGRLIKTCIPKAVDILNHKETCELEEFEWACGYAIEALKEMQHYKDLEEQGRLIEQKRGKWEPLDSYVCDSDCMWRCSECKVDLYFELGTPLEYEMYYCPHCGAKMELKELEGDKE